MTAAPDELHRKRRRGLLGLHYRLYDWVLHWSGHPRAGAALFLLSLAEASFFPVPPDVLLISMSLARPRRATLFALIATVGSITGALIGWLIGWGLWAALDDWVFANLGFLGFTPQNFDTVRDLYQSNAFLALFGAAFSPIPFKVFTIAAGVFGIGIPVFVLASTIGRAGRFVLVALLVGLLGPRVQPFIERYLGWLTLAFVVLLVAGFWVIGTLGH